jgi:hypothetical protein
MLCYGADEPFAPCCSGPATADCFLDGMDDILSKVTGRDTVLIAFVNHMAQGYLINDTLSSFELNSKLTGIPPDATVVVIIEGCYSGAILPNLTAADIAYASAGAEEPCYGGWMLFFLDALGTHPGTSNLADSDGNGFVSFGEAYDYAADPERLREWYSALPRDVWPPERFYPTPSRNNGELQYYFYLDQSAVAPF